MGRVTQGLSLNIVLNPRNLSYRIKLVRSSNYILRITRHAIAWLYPSWTSASRRSKNSWIGDSFDRLCVRGEHRFDLLRRRIVLRDYVQTSGCRKRLRTSIIFQGSTIRSTSLKIDGDQGTASKDLVQVPIGPVTRARAKKFKDVLNGLIQELWAQANSWRPIEHDPRGQQRIVTLIQVLEGSGQG